MVCRLRTGSKPAGICHYIGGNEFLHEVPSIHSKDCPFIWEDSLLKFDFTLVTAPPLGVVSKVQKIGWSVQVYFFVPSCSDNHVMVTSVVDYLCC